GDRDREDLRLAGRQDHDRHADRDRPGGQARHLRRRLRPAVGLSRRPGLRSSLERTRGTAHAVPRSSSVRDRYLMFPCCSAATAVSVPNRPWGSPSIPAVKNSVLRGPALPPLPKESDQRLFSTNGSSLPAFNTLPRKAPVATS